MKKLFLIIILSMSINLNAGDYRYDWANIGNFGLGEISNQLLIYCCDDTDITSIPAFETYWKWYFLGVIIIVFIIMLLTRKRELK
jgi:hypothetical protein